MNSEYPPFSLPSPEIADRRKERPPYVPLPPEVLRQRQELASRLTAKITPLSNSLRQMSEDELKAVFFQAGARRCRTPGRHRLETHRRVVGELHSGNT